MKQVRYILLAAGAIALIAALAWWQQRTMVAGLPPRYVCANELDARAKAGPTAYAVLGTGSMAPFIPPASKGADPMKTVVAYAVPGGKKYADIRKGDLVSYWADWAHGNVLHQAAQKDSGGWIMSGLHNSQSESFARVTPETFRSVISEVYVW